MSENVKLRRYERADQEAVLDMWRRAWASAYPQFDWDARSRKMRAYWHSELVPNTTIILAEIENVIIGFFTLDHKGYIDQFAVALEQWGSKVGAMLMHEAKRLSPKLLTLNVNSDNFRAIRFYEKQGFVIAGEGVNSDSCARTYDMQWTPGAE